MAIDERSYRTKYFQLTPSVGSTLALTKPPAAVGHPPAEHHERQSKRQPPPERNGKVHGRAEDEKQHPKNLLFHLRKPYHGSDRRDRTPSPPSRVIGKPKKPLPLINTDYTDLKKT